MGNNLDLVQMLGLPKEITCPKCNHITTTLFDDYDVECGNPNKEKGEWALDVYCPTCENKWEQNYKVILETPQV